MEEEPIERPRRLIARPDDLLVALGGMARARREMLAVAYLDDRLGLIGLRLGYSRSSTAIDLPVRRIFGDALALNCSGIILVHNHPSEDATPSEADVAATTALARLGREIGIRVLDHLVIGMRGWTSFRRLGFL